MIKNKCACRLFKICRVVMLLLMLLTGCNTAQADDAWKKTVIDEVSSENNTAQQETDSQQSIFVHVCGAVVTPGVYELSGDSRVYDAVNAAGGMLPEADNTCLNLASQLQDGIQIQVFTKEEVVKQEKVQADNGKININTASASELTQLSGIGDSRALAIIAYRDSHGAFETIDQIKQVDGIKDGLFQKIKDKIIVN